MMASASYPPVALAKRRVLSRIACCLFSSMLVARSRVPLSSSSVSSIPSMPSLSSSSRALALTITSLTIWVYLRSSMTEVPTIAVTTMTTRSMLMSAHLAPVGMVFLALSKPRPESPGPWLSVAGVLDWAVIGLVASFALAEAGVAALSWVVAAWSGVVATGLTMAAELCAGAG